MRENDYERRTYERKPRYRLINGLWYFKVREGYLLGPYDCVLDASIGVEHYISLNTKPRLAETTY